MLKSSDSEQAWTLAISGAPEFEENLESKMLLSLESVMLAMVLLMSRERYSMV